MEVEKISKGLMETNIDPHLKEDESIAEPIEELIKIQVDPHEPSRVVKINKGLRNELAQHLIGFISLNQDMFVWMHVDMVGIHTEVKCY